MRREKKYLKIMPIAFGAIDKIIKIFYIIWGVKDGI
jgi:hypothetical protein